MRTFMYAMVGAVCACVAAPADRGASAQTADEVLTEVRRTFAVTRDARIAFTQTSRLRPAGASQKSDGILLYKQANRYRIETDGIVVATDGDTVWRYVETSNQLFIDRTRSDPRSFSPERLLKGPPEGFSAAHLGNDGSHHVIKLTATGPQGAISSIKLWVEDEHWIIRKAEVTDLSGTVMTFAVTSYQANIGIANDRFRISAPEGVEIIDLR